MFMDLKAYDIARSQFLLVSEKGLIVHVIYVGSFLADDCSDWRFWPTTL